MILLPGGVIREDKESSAFGLRLVADGLTGLLGLSEPSGSDLRKWGVWQW